MKNLFPTAIVLLFAGAGILQLINGRYNEALYSFSAAALNIAIYFRPF